jgi:D-proline reductase (dithiol) PrdB
VEGPFPANRFVDRSHVRRAGLPSTDHRLLSTALFMTLSRKCVPFTPFEGELSKATVAIVSAGGVHLRDQEPFNIADELGDLSYRIIPPDADSSDLMVTHHHYDHADADQDVNVVFPLDVLRDLRDEGFIKNLALKHVGYMGYTMQLKAMYEGTAPQIANEIDRGSRADAVLLTGG